MRVTLNKFNEAIPNITVQAIAVRLSRACMEVGERPALLRGATFVAMVQAAEVGNRHNVAVGE